MKSKRTETASEIREVALRIIAGQEPDEMWKQPYLSLAHLHTGSSAYQTEVARLALRLAEARIS